MRAFAQFPTHDLRAMCMAAAWSPTAGEVDIAHVALLAVQKLQRGHGLAVPEQDVLCTVRMIAGELAARVGDGWADLHDIERHLTDRAVSTHLLRHILAGGRG